jgi:hypothetical protein
LVAVQNGVLRISKNIELLEANSHHGFTAAQSIEWGPKAEMPIFSKVLIEALPDPQDREPFLDVLATALIPDCRYEAALVCRGEASTGKSTVIAPIEKSSARRLHHYQWPIYVIRWVIS